MRTITLRSFSFGIGLRHAVKGVLAISALIVLTGAKGEGCGGGDESGSSSAGQTSGDPNPGECQAGTHREVICDGLANCDDKGCHEACVPDECPDGSVVEYSCGGPVPLENKLIIAPDCPPGDEECMPPFPGDPPPCGYICVPADPCGPGAHQEKVCAAWAEDAGTNDPPTLPPEDCWLECVPDSICPDGTIQQDVCYGEADPSDPNGKPAECSVECVPVCPDGGVPITVCDPADPTDPATGVCWSECKDPNACPPGQHEIEACWEDPDGNSGCDDVCVDDVQSGGGSGSSGGVPRE